MICDNFEPVSMLNCGVLLLHNTAWQNCRIDENEIDSRWAVISLVKPYMDSNRKCVVPLG